MQKIVKIIVFLVLCIGFIYFIHSSFLDNVRSEDSSSGLELNKGTNKQLKDSAAYENLQRVALKIEKIDNTDDVIESYLRDTYPLISDKTIEQVESTQFINKFLMNDTLGIVDFYVNFYVPKNYLESEPRILWELNIAAFQSHIYQIYNGDTVLIDTWPNVVGKPSTKTYTGHYEAFRLRNWPFWKDPESPDSVRPTPPGPNNPLGLFVVHYDENSLRYFHGTNKSYLLSKTVRALSHGCVRNVNDNIEKMKEFIIKKVIKSDELTYWLESKKSMVYEIKETDRFPVRIIYKTFDVDKDEYGEYIIFYDDIYSYGKHEKLSEFDDPSLITLTSSQNILNEIKQKRAALQVPDGKLIPILDGLVSDHKDYQKYYFDDLMGSQVNNN